MAFLDSQHVYFKKTWKLVSMFFVVVAFLITPSTARAEKINSFESEIIVHHDSSISVTENIEYDFEQESKHGIFRTIPLDNSDGSKISIKDISVKNEKGIDYPFQKSANNNTLTIKIGDANKTIIGEHSYIIYYTVENALVTFDHFDEVYWNVTGNEWKVPMQNVKSSVSFDGITIDAIAQSSCYEGIKGATKPCLMEVSGNTLISHSSFLNPGEGVTIAVAVNKGLISGISRIGGEKYAQSHSVRKILEIVIGILVILFAFLYRFVFIRDPKSKNPMVAWYEPPVGFSPLSVGVLIDKKLDTRDLVAQILSLAERGYIRITRVEDTTLKVFHSTDYIFEALKTSYDLDFIGDKQTLKILFASESIEIGRTQKLSEIDNYHAQAVFKEMKKEIKDTLAGTGYLNPNLSKNTTKIAVAIIFLSIVVEFVTRSFGDKSFIDAFPIICLWIAAFVIATYKGKYTQLGADTRQQIKGFKEFLSVTDKDRFDFHNSPEKTSEQFMEYLPYAIALGVEKKWATQFKDIVIPTPTWYQGNNMAGFIATDFVYQIDSFNSKFSSQTKTSSSGSGGGGFSGGGSGGGGGGSW